MVDKIEMSLDDIIKKNKIGFRRPGAAGKKPIGKGKPSVNNRRQNNQTTKFRGTANRQIVRKGPRPTQQRGVNVARKFPRVRKPTR